MKNRVVSGIFAIILASFLPSAVFAYTNPGQPAGYVNDFANVLSSEQRVSLEDELSAFEKATGNEISVVTIKNLGGDTVENFAVELFKEWGIGKKGKDNGILALVAILDRKMRIEVGYGLEGYLTDAQSNFIIRNTMTPSFRANDYYGGIDGAVSQIIAAVSPDYASGVGISASPVNQRSNGSGWDSSNFIFFLFFIPIWLASILGRSKSWWAGGVVGGVVGVIIGFMLGFFYFGLISIAFLIPVGFLFDFIVSKTYAKSVGLGLRPPWWIGGGRGSGGFGGGGFGGFGGGGSGGGGSSGSW